MDLRVRKAPTTAERDLPNSGGPFDRLLWASAGLVTTDDEIVNGGSNFPQYEPGWTDWHQAASSDEEEMDKASSGDQERLWTEEDAGKTVIGRVLISDPVTGQMTVYEEQSINLPIMSTNNDGTRTTTVLVLHDDTQDFRGVIVRVGDICQGVLRNGLDISIERWQWIARENPPSPPPHPSSQPHSNQEEADTRPITVVPQHMFGSSERGSGQQVAYDRSRGDWERQVRVGSRFLPCGIAFVESVAPIATTAVRPGATVQAGDMTWVVVERYVW